MAFGPWSSVRETEESSSSTGEPDERLCIGEGGAGTSSSTQRNRGSWRRGALPRKRPLTSKEREGEGKGWEWNGEDGNGSRGGWRFVWALAEKLRVSPWSLVPDTPCFFFCGYSREIDSVEKYRQSVVLFFKLKSHHRPVSRDFFSSFAWGITGLAMKPAVTTSLDTRTK
jgi:hypothetical protein